VTAGSAWILPSLYDDRWSRARASVISSLSSCPALGDTIQFRPNPKQNDLEILHTSRSFILNGAPFFPHSEPNCEPNVADLTGCSFAAAAFDRIGITMPANRGIALRMMRRVDGVGLGFKKRAVKALPVRAGNISLKKRRHSGQIERGRARSSAARRWRGAV
jgi:hypothetical protein